MSEIPTAIWRRSRRGGAGERAPVDAGRMEAIEEFIAHHTAAGGAPPES